LDGYKWSSHREYAGLRAVPAWLCMDWQRHWGSTAAEAQMAYRQRLDGFFAAGTVASPWERLRGGLVLGGEALWQKARGLVAGKAGQDESCWTRSVEREQVRQRVEALVAQEAEERIKVWLLARVAGEPNAAVGRRFGYRDGSGVAHVLRRLDEAAKTNSALAEQLQRLREAAGNQPT
jgi:hypothetical protein